MFCTHCGAKLVGSEKFCTNCGAPIDDLQVEKDHAPAPSSQTPQPTAYADTATRPLSQSAAPVDPTAQPLPSPPRNYDQAPIPQHAAPKRSNGKIAVIIAGAVAAIVVVVVLVVVDPFRIMPGHGDAGNVTPPATEGGTAGDEATSSNDASAPSSQESDLTSPDSSGNGDSANQDASPEADNAGSTAPEQDDSVARSATVETGSSISGDTWSVGPEIGFSISGSSVLTDDYGVYVYDNAKDRVLSTAWVEGASNSGEGQSIVLTFAQPENVAGITILSGYHKSDDIYYKNARPKEITLLTHGEVICSVILSDVYHQPQTIRFDQPVDTDEIMVRIDSVYPGNRYADCAISEIAVIPA